MLVARGSRAVFDRPGPEDVRYARPTIIDAPDRSDELAVVAERAAVARVEEGSNGLHDQRRAELLVQPLQLGAREADTAVLALRLRVGRPTHALAAHIGTLITLWRVLWWSIDLVYVHCKQTNVN